jgi:hypothetical protein
MAGLFISPKLLIISMLYSTRTPLAFGMRLAEHFTGHWATWGLLWVVRAVFGQGFIIFVSSFYGRLSAVRTSLACGFSTVPAI